MGTDFEALNQAWTCTISLLDSAFVSSDAGSGIKAVGIITRHGLGDMLEEHFLEQLKQLLVKQVVPRFWTHLTSSDDCAMTPSDAKQHGRIEIIDPVKRAVTGLHECIFGLQSMFELIQRVRQHLSVFDERSVFDYVRTLYKGILLSQMPRNFNEVLARFYSVTFKAFVQGSNPGGSSEDHAENVRCNGCTLDRSECYCKEVMLDFHAVNAKLNDLDLMECLAGEAITGVIHELIQLHVESTCKGNFETLFLATLEKWLEDVVVGWLLAIFEKQHGVENEDRTAATNRTVQSFKAHLQHVLYKTYASTRMEEMFNIIIEFPESQPAVEDLKECLTKIDVRSKLIQSLREALETRLLHPGVNTNDILTAYTNTVKTLSVLDPAGIILELVCEPVHKYLRTRQDTVRCIVSSLTDETSGDLADELVKGEPLVMDESYQSEDEADGWEHWKPDPVDADPEKYSKTRRTSDIISMLVNIYGSKELFVKEYRTLLADRILTQFRFDVRREIRYLELLKLRFGEAKLHVCEVMLKDVADSKRINSHIHSEDVEKMESSDCKDFKVNAMILSAQFWPAFREGKIEVPAKIQSALQSYTKEFEALKGNRTLAWQPHLGQVTLEIELKDRTLELKVSPVQATILMLFEEKPEWTLDELSLAMRTPSSQLKRKVAFWQSHGIIRESKPDCYVLLEEQREKTSDVVIIDEDEAESAMASLHDQREEELQVFWSYIVGMLTNLESLSLERIHTMLKMFATQSTSTMECSIHELRGFLQIKVSEHKLLFSGGLYKLPKPSN